MARFTYFFEKIEAHTKRDLWIKSNGRVCEANKHVFCPVTEQTESGKTDVDKCFKCGTVRIPPSGVYPTVKTKKPKISKKTERQKGIV